MKPGSVKWKRFMIKIRSYTRITIALCIASIAVRPETASLAIGIVGITIAFTKFLAGFEPIHEDPNWELVYPELALKQSEPLDVKKSV
jgi:hypothetical protein